MAEAADLNGTAPILLHANINLDKIDIPIETESPRLQKFKESRARTAATGNQMSALVNTRDRAVRPKAAVSNRTIHCFSNSKFSCFLF